MRWEGLTPQQPRPTLCSAPACGSPGHAPHLSRPPSPYPTKQAENTHLQSQLGLRRDCPCPGIGPHTVVLSERKVNSDPSLPLRRRWTDTRVSRYCPRGAGLCPGSPSGPTTSRSLTPCLQFPDGFPEERKQLTGADSVQREVSPFHACRHAHSSKAERERGS